MVPTHALPRRRLTRILGNLDRRTLLALVPALSLSLALSFSVPACTSGDTGSSAGSTTGSGGSGGEGSVEERVDALLERMSLEEKVAQMHGTQLSAISDLYETPFNERLGIPSFRMVDGPRGVRAGKATTFPVGMARGATWDPALERLVGAAMGEETAAKGGNVLLAPTINILRHPAWGRAQETYGEDTAHLGAMGVAFIEGAQQHVLASVKHFAANSIEDTRFLVDVTIDERTLQEVYLPHFRRAVKEAHVASVMSAYNQVNGLYCSENPHLLRDVLKGEWGFDGFVESDWFLGTHSTAPAALAGLDIEMPAGIFFGDELVSAVNDGSVPMATIDEAARRILRKKVEFHLDHPAAVDPAVVESAAHTRLTLDVEREAIVLLKNEATALPLDRASIGSVVVVGALAATANLGDTGSSNSVPSHAITPLAGIQDRAENVTVTPIAGPVLSSADEAAIAAAGAAIVVVGLTADDEGERIASQSGGDRHDPSLRLSPEHEALIHAVAAKNPRTVVVLEGGSAIVVRPWVDEVSAVLMAWYPGEEGGDAIADVLFGLVSPSGKLPLTFPRNVGDLPPFVNDKNAVTYGFLHGYRYLDDAGTAPEFPFGFGLSYTTFSYANLQLAEAAVAPDGAVTATVDVTNSGPVAGDEIVEVFVGYEGSSVQRAPLDLKAFARIHLEPGETRAVPLGFSARDLAYWDAATSAWVVEPIGYVVKVGSSSRNLPLGATLTIKP